MSKSFIATSAKLIAVATLALAAPLSIAYDQPQVSWSISVGNAYPAPVYAPPAVVYVQPQPVYVRPRPVFVQPATVVHYGPQHYYVQEARPHKHKHKHKHWKHQRDRYDH